MNKHVKSYLERRFSLIPLGNNSKIPCIPWKEAQFKRAEPDEVDKWPTEFPGSNIGIVTGRISGIVVIDVDDPKLLSELYKKLPEAERTTRVRTKRGFHFYFKDNHKNIMNTNNFLGLGLELKSKGGYVVAPPSVVDDNTYTFEIPLSEILLYPEVAPEVKERPKPKKKKEEPVACISQIMARDLREGERNCSLFVLYNLMLQNKKHTAVHVRNLVRRKNLSLASPLKREEVEAIFRKPYSFTCNSIRESLPYISCKNCKFKPLSQRLEGIRERIRKWKDLSPITQKEAKKAIVQDLIKLSETQREGIINEIVKAKIFKRVDLEVSLKTTRKSGRIKLFSERILTATDLIHSDLPEEELIIGNGLLPKVGFMMIGAYTKEGKTILSLQLALNLVSKTPFLGEFPILDHNKVLFIYGENTEADLKGYLKRQIAGFKDKDRIIIEDAELSNLTYFNGRNFSFSSKKDLDELRGLLIKEEFNVIILDPVGRFLDFDINRGENVLKFLNNLDTLGERAWILIHHYRKPDANTDSKTDAIYKLVGSSNLANYCESFVGLERLDIKKSETLKVLRFRMRRAAQPAPVYLRRIPEYLYYETVDFDDLPTVSGVKMNDIVGILGTEFKGRATFSQIVDFSENKLGVTRGYIWQLLRDAKKAGLLKKEGKGKGSHWDVM